MRRLRIRQLSQEPTRFRHDVEHIRRMELRSQAGKVVIASLVLALWERTQTRSGKCDPRVVSRGIKVKNRQHSAFARDRF